MKLIKYKTWVDARQRYEECSLLISELSSKELSEKYPGKDIRHIEVEATIEDLD